MNLARFIWEWYKVIIAATSVVLLALVIIGAIVERVAWRRAQTRCPNCGGIKFGLTAGGGPPKCMKCGWQENMSKEKTENLPAYDSKYNIVGWYGKKKKEEKTV